MLIDTLFIHIHYMYLTVYNMNVLDTDAIIEGSSNITYIVGLTPLPIELICNVTGEPSWIVNGSVCLLSSLTNGTLRGHNRAGTNILVNRPVNNTEYICRFATNDGETLSVPANITIAGTQVYKCNVSSCVAIYTVHF